MKYINIEKARFIERKNRFVAICEVNGEKASVHVPNTGRCGELFKVGATVYLKSEDTSGGRKTAWTLIAVEKSGVLFNVDSHAPNVIFKEAVESGALVLTGIGDVVAVKAEATFEDSRLDFFIKGSYSDAYVEVKGVTLEKNGTAKFPDAPTQRGIKHLKALMRAVDRGYKAFAVFVLQFEGAEVFTPNRETHGEFADVLKEAEEHGVKVIAFECRVHPDGLSYLKHVNAEI